MIAEDEAMEFNLEMGISVLERTPATLRAMLLGLPQAWVMSNEGGDSWSPYDVVGHLVSLERIDWIPRARIILEHGPARPFDPVDRLAMFTQSQGKSLEQLLDELAELRQDNIAMLRSMNLTAEDYARHGRHPALGDVNLGQLLAAWVVHDLNHIHQIAQTMARQYTEAVGAWREYLLVL
jgi:DinB superfamily